MTNRALFPILILSTLNIYAQRITGTITNLEDKRLIFTSNIDYLTRKSDTVYADEHNKFSVRLNLSKPAFVTLENKGISADDIYLLPNSTLIITGNGKSWSTYHATRKYAGSAGFINDYYAYLGKSPTLKKYNFNKKTYQLPEEKFVEAIDKYFFIRDSIRNDYFNKTLKTEKLKAFVSTDSINGLYYKGTIWLSYLNTLPEEKKDLFLKTYIDPLAQQNDNALYLASPKYAYFWKSFMDYNIERNRKIYPDSLVKTAISYYESIPKLISQMENGKLRQITAKNYLQNISYFYGGVPESNIKLLDTAIAKLYILLNNKKMVTTFESLFNEKNNFRNNTRPGVPAKDFLATDSSGKVYALKDFKGKIIYLDLWASWCTPCLAELPEARNMVNRYNSDRFIYIAVSIDDKRENWISALKRHNPPGLQLWLKDGFNSKFTLGYSISGIPHYLLIDEHGKLINYAAPKPSSGEKIHKLLEDSIAKYKP